MSYVPSRLPPAPQGKADHPLCGGILSSHGEAEHHGGKPNNLDCVGEAFMTRDVLNKHSCVPTALISSLSQGLTNTWRHHKDRGPNTSRPGPRRTFLKCWVMFVFVVSVPPRSTAAEGGPEGARMFLPNMCHGTESRNGLLFLATP